MTASTDRDPTTHSPTDREGLEGVAGHLAGEVSSPEDVLTVAQEQAHVSVERRETGGVRVRVVTDEGPVLYPVALEAETVEVPVTLRRQRAVVEQLEPGAAEPGPGEG